MRCQHGFIMTIQECNYSPSHWNSAGKNANEVISDYVMEMKSYASQLQQSAIERQSDLKYYTGDDHCKGIDIYGFGNLPPGNRMFIFVHGGYWIEGNKELAKSMVKNLVLNDIITAIVGYNLAPSKSIQDIISEIVEAVKYLHDWAQERQFVSICLAGHSAGAHLVTCALLQIKAKLPLLKQIALFAGIYNLEPFLSFKMNELIGLTSESAEKFSPAKHIDQLVDSYPLLRVMIATAEYECPGIAEQNGEFYEKLSKRCRDKENLGEYAPKLSIYNIEGEDHFTLISNLHKRNSRLLNALINFINEPL